MMPSTLDSQSIESTTADFEKVLNTEEAAALLQIHPKTLQKMARQGSVPAFRIGDLWRFRASALDEWLRSGVRSLMHTIFQCAERWELIHNNPIKLVRVKGGTRRLKTPRVLAPEQFHSLLPLIREPYRTMVLIAGCLGLRVSEIVALQWSDFDFPGLALVIQRSVVHGRVGDVKTEYSRDAFHSIRRWWRL